MKCSFCGKKSIIFRKYEGRAYCQEHFIQSIERKAKKTIRKHRMLKKGEKTAVALSGGKDSLTALHILHNILKNWPRTELIAITIDEGIKNYRTKILAHAKRICKELKISQYVFSFKDEFGKTMDMKVRELKRKRLSGIEDPCTYCGIARRYLLNKKARELGAKRLCTGHNLDDEIQGIMLNYLKGNLSRASRLSGLLKPCTKTGKKLFIPRIKPLRDVPEADIALYAKLQAQKNPTFKQNFTKKCPYKGGLRVEVENFLNDMERKYPGIKFSFLETFDKIKPCIEKLMHTESDMNKCGVCGEPATGKTCKTCELWR